MKIPFTVVSLCLCGVLRRRDPALARMSSCGVLCAYTVALCVRERRSAMPVTHAAAHAAIHVLPVLLLSNPPVSTRHAAVRTGLLAALRAAWHTAAAQHRAYGFRSQPPQWRVGLLAYVAGASLSARCT